MRAVSFIADIGIRSPVEHWGASSSGYIIGIGLRINGSFSLMANHGSMMRFLLQEKIGEYRGS